MKTALGVKDKSCNYINHI